MSYRLTDQIARWVETAVNKHDAGEQIAWDISLAPAPNGVAVLVVVLTPGAVLNTVIHTAHILQSPSVVTEDDLDDLIRKMIEALRAERSRALAGGNGGGQVEGLHVPGQ